MTNINPLLKRKVLPAGDMVEWAKKLKSTRNPFLASSPNPSDANNIPLSMLGAVGAAGFNALVTDKLPSKWHLPAHGTLALGSLFLPKHSISAALSGAFFYAAISETYYKYIKTQLLDSAKSAIK